MEWTREDEKLSVNVKGLSLSSLSLVPYSWKQWREKKGTQKWQSSLRPLNSPCMQTHLFKRHDKDRIGDSVPPQATGKVKAYRNPFKGILCGYYYREFPWWKHLAHCIAMHIRFHSIIMIESTPRQPKGLPFKVGESLAGHIALVDLPDTESVEFALQGTGRKGKSDLRVPSLLTPLHHTRQLTVKKEYQKWKKWMDGWISSSSSLLIPVQESCSLQS